MNSFQKSRLLYSVCVLYRYAVYNDAIKLFYMALLLVRYINSYFSPTRNVKKINKTVSDCTVKLLIFSEHLASTLYCTYGYYTPCIVLLFSHITGGTFNTRGNPAV